MADHLEGGFLNWLFLANTSEGKWLVGDNEDITALASLFLDGVATPADGETPKPVWMPGETQPQQRPQPMGGSGQQQPIP